MISGRARDFSLSVAFTPDGGKISALNIWIGLGSEIEIKLCSEGCIALLDAGAVKKRYRRGQWR